jgi:sulfonate transport system ATP-binding protein
MVSGLAPEPRAGVRASTMSRAGLELEARRLGKTFGSREVLRDLDLRVRSGEFVAIVGRSGCGKSTLLRTFAGLEQPTRGEIRFDGSVSRGLHPDVRMIFQESRLLPWRTAISNVEVGERSEGGKRVDAKTRAAHAQELLAHVGLGDRALDWPGRLSGGQRQRVALARGLMSDPRLLLLDEPLGALDALTRLEMQRLVEGLWLERQFTAVLVTHEIQEAVALADRVIVLEEGRITGSFELAMPRPRVREELAFIETCAALLKLIMGPAPHPEAVAEPLRRASSSR